LTQRPRKPPLQRCKALINSISRSGVAKPARGRGRANLLASPSREFRPTWRTNLPIRDGPSSPAGGSAADGATTGSMEDYVGGERGPAAVDDEPVWGLSQANSGRRRHRGRRPLAGLRTKCILPSTLPRERRALGDTLRSRLAWARSNGLGKRRPPSRRGRPGGGYFSKRPKNVIESILVRSSGISGTGAQPSETAGASHPSAELVRLASRVLTEVGKASTLSLLPQ
jgi:hypothetical protein